MKIRSLQIIGYGIGIVAFVVAMVSRENSVVMPIAIGIFSFSTAYTFIETNHRKMMIKDKEYRINCNDERTILIRDKVKASLAYVLMYANLLIGLIAFTLKNYVVGGLLIMMNAGSPIIMFFLSKHYEKKY